MNDGPNPEHVRGSYDRLAGVFDLQRQGSLLEAGWLSRFSDLLPDRAEVLDLGCGSGEPVARILSERGFKVTGVDFAPGMLELARNALPQLEWIEADFRMLNLGRRFDGVVAWHSFFHLTAAAQRQALPHVLDHLRPGGVLMMTLGTEEGEAPGYVAGETVYHASLDAMEYHSILERNGVHVRDFVVNDASCGGANVLFAQKTA